MKIIWVIVSCNTTNEAKKIGQELLTQRLAVCFEILPRLGAWFFWPPKKNKIETAKGCLLIMDTLPQYFPEIEKVVKKLHSDKTPFVGSIELKNINIKYVKWLKGELK
ncbi:MAG: divalent cation tolerance protein CutA [Patescibacteria group bacterium]